MAEHENKFRGSAVANDLVVPLACLFVLVGSVFAMIGLVMGGWTLQFGSTAEQTEGEVIEVIGNARRDSFRPIVRYRVAGTDYEHHSNLSSDRYAVGDKVRVLYQPNNPESSQIDSFLDRWMFPLVFGGGGTLFALIGCGKLLGHRTARPAATS